MTYFVHADGGARGNPGPAGAGAIVRDETGKTVFTVSEYLGETTNNVAEYTAVLRALEGLSQVAGAKDAEVKIEMDSELVVKQMRGEYKVKHPNLKPLADAVRQVAGGFRTVTFSHIPREKMQTQMHLQTQQWTAGPDSMNGAAFSGALGCVLGILLASFIPLPLSIALFVGVIGGVMLIAFSRLRAQSYLYIGTFLLLAALGIGRVAIVPDTLPPTLIDKVGSSIVIEGLVVADPDIREEHQRITIQTEDTRFLAVAPLYPEIRYGETVRATGRLVRPEPFETDTGRTFRYDRFLAKDGIFALIERAEVEVVAPRSGMFNNLRGFFSDLKQGFLDALATALPEPHASLAGGLVAGGKQGLGEHLLDAFILSGLVHIVVLSGYNVMIVAEAVMRLLSVFPRRVAASAAALTIGVFVLAAGAGAASIRAGLMAGIALFARATYRTYDAMRALIAAALLMLCINPLLLAFDPGFQLSFIATAGLILGAPVVEKRLAFITHDFLRDIAASTIAAQIAVLPLLLYQNGLFSVIALPANLLVLPMVPLAMAASALAGLGGALAPIVAPIVGLPAYALLSYIIGMVEVTATLPFAAFTVPAFPFVLTLAAYAGLSLLLWNNRSTIAKTPASSRLLRSS